VTTVFSRMAGLGGAPEMKKAIHDGGRYRWPKIRLMRHHAGDLVLQRHLTPCAVGLPTHRAGGAPRRPQNACARRVRRPAALYAVLRVDLAEAAAAQGHVPAPVGADHEVTLPSHGNREFSLTNRITSSTWQKHSPVTVSAQP